MIHKRSHNREKPYSCSHCDYKCSTSGALKTHERIHTGAKPFSCSHCDYKCAQLCHLEKHERIHTGAKPFTCSQCDYKCSDPSALKKHKRTHTGVKPFSCSFCDKKFIEKSNMKIHERIHTWFCFLCVPMKELALLTKYTANTKIYKTILIKWHTPSKRRNKNLDIFFPKLWRNLILTCEKGLVLVGWSWSCWLEKRPLGVSAEVRNSRKPCRPGRPVRRKSDSTRE